MTKTRVLNRGLVVGAFVVGCICFDRFLHFLRYGPMWLALILFGCIYALTMFAVQRWEASA